MSRKHRMDVPLDIADGEVVLSVEYTYSPGCPARIHYDENDHPAEGPELEIYNITVDKAPVPAWLDKILTDGDWLTDYLNEKHEDGGRDE